MAARQLDRTASACRQPLFRTATAARESILHVLAETIEWFDKYVKNKGRQ